jgi:5,5'-dehydrodivanillate O-demethylase
MLTTEQNERFTRVGAGTPCGEMMRRYWHPIAASSQLPKPGTRPVRLLGEDLVLYRDKAGKVGLLEPHCAHRRASLLYGMPEDCGLRCTYHGWMFDATGQCIDQPFETFSIPASKYKEEIKIRAYPVEELGGLIFAYLGPEPRPLLPRWEAYVRDDVYREIGMCVIPCNWLQTVENAGDTSHVVTTHYQYGDYVLEKLGRPDLKRHENSSGATGYEIGRQRPIHAQGVGAVIFPYLDAQGDGTYQIRVPIDDTHTLHVWYMIFDEHAAGELGVELKPQKDPREIPFFEVPVPTLVNGQAPDWTLLDNNSGQDLVMWYSQGAIVDRSKENLGAGDRNILQLRKLLQQQISIVESGGDPINTYRDPEQNKCIIPLHQVPGRPRLSPEGRPDRTNAARKYSPAYQKATVARLGARALLDPAH